MKIFSTLFALASLFCLQSVQAVFSIVDYNPSHRDAIYAALLQDEFLIFPGEEFIKKGLVSEEDLHKQLNRRLEEILNNDDDLSIKKVIVDESKVIGLVFYAVSKEQTIEDACYGCNQKMKEMILANRPDLKRDGEKARKYVELDVIMIMPEYRSKGLGTMLLSHAIEDAQKRWPDIEVLKVDVLATNSSARQFFEKQGFVVSARPLSAYSLEGNLISYEKVQIVSPSG